MILFTWYLSIGLKDNSAAQAPERLYRETAFVSFAAVTFVAACLVLLINLPLLVWVVEPRLIRVRF